MTEEAKVDLVVTTPDNKVIIMPEAYTKPTFSLLRITEQDIWTAQQSPLH